MKLIFRSDIHSVPKNFGAVVKIENGESILEFPERTAQLLGVFHCRSVEELMIALFPKIPCPMVRMCDKLHWYFNEFIDARQHLLGLVRDGLTPEAKARIGM